MTIKEAMETRHTVRRYTDRAISRKVAARLMERIAAHNAQYRLSMELVQDDTGAFGPLLRLVLAKGVRNYIILAGEDREDLEERLGYCGADVMLYARTLGLDTWWEKWPEEWREGRQERRPKEPQERLQGKKNEHRKRSRGSSWWAMALHRGSPTGLKVRKRSVCIKERPRDGSRLGSRRYYWPLRL